MQAWRIWAVVGALVWGAWQGVEAQPLRQIPNPRQIDGGWVADMAGVLSVEQKTRLNQLITQLERETSAEIAVVILRRTEDATPKEYATELFNRWGVGKRGADNGVLMLVALGDRRVEVETGYGLEAILPDAAVGEILDRVVVPRFRTGDIAGGVLGGVQAIAERIRRAQTTGAYEPTASTGARQHGASPAPVIALIVFGGGVIVLLIFALRERPPKCPTCQQPMRLLDEDADDAYLNELQRTEEQLGSVNYLVWRCEPCETLEIFPKMALFNAYIQCPKCGGRTVHETARVVRQPTYRRSGLEIIAYKCKNPRCDYREEKERVLPRLVRVETDWSYGRHGRRRSDDWFISGGFGGGGFGGFGGGSSSGGFGDFGGGSSGGGGAGRGW